MAIELGTPSLSPALWGQELVSFGDPSPFCFAPKHEVGIFVDSSAVRKGPPLDVNQGQRQEREKERTREERKMKGWNQMDGVQPVENPFGITEEGWLAG